MIPQKSKKSKKSLFCYREKYKIFFSVYYYVISGWEENNNE